jgi:(2Fe-2S) ferredoxin
MRRHMFVCTNSIGSGKPACGQRGTAIATAVQTALARSGALGPQVTACGCLGICFDGPSAVVYPDGVWYGALDIADADALARHLVDGVVHGARRIDPPGDIE